MCSEPEDPGGVGRARKGCENTFTTYAYGIYRTHVRSDEVWISEDRVCYMMFVVTVRSNMR